jgi:3-hydroxybutyryl-CoA dehydrogenase
VGCDDLAEAVSGAWMVIEAIPERLDLKRDVFGQVDELAEADAILASNSLVDPDQPDDRQGQAP